MCFYLLEVRTKLVVQLSSRSFISSLILASYVLYDSDMRFDLFNSFDYENNNYNANYYILNGNTALIGILSNEY